MDSIWIYLDVGGHFSPAGKGEGSFRVSDIAVNVVIVITALFVVTDLTISKKNRLFSRKNVSNSIYIFQEVYEKDKKK